MKYRCTCTIIFDLDTDLSYDKAYELARQHIDEINLKSGIENTRTLLQIDKIKSKVEKIKIHEFDVEEILSSVSNDTFKKEFKVNDTIYQVKMNTDRYQVFKNNRSCVSCGLEGTRMFMECHPSDMMPHFNLYGEEDKKLILFTKDHIKPRALGGEDCLDNYQTMCSVCNNLKAHSNLSIESVYKLRKIYNQNRKKISKKKLHLLIEEERLKLDIPWPHLFVESKEIPKNAILISSDLIVYEKDKELYAVSQKELPEGSVVKGYVRNHTYLEEVMRINNFVVCSLPDGRMIFVNMNYVSLNNA
jgi:hypothetical protein